MTLLAKLEAAGLDVQPYGNWINRGNTWGLNYGKPQPAGIMHHHTAAPVPFHPQVDRRPAESEHPNTARREGVAVSRGGV